MKLAIIGAGKWGQALYHAYSQDNEVVISSRTVKEIENFVSMEEALAYEYLIMAIPAQFVRSWMEEHFSDQGQKILVAAKGIEPRGSRPVPGLFSMRSMAILFLLIDWHLSQGPLLRPRCRSRCRQH